MKDDSRIEEIKRKLKPLAYTKEQQDKFNRHFSARQILQFLAPIFGISLAVFYVFNQQMVNYLFSHHLWFFHHPDKIIPFFEYYFHHGMKGFR